MIKIVKSYVCLLFTKGSYCNVTKRWEHNTNNLITNLIYGKLNYCARTDTEREKKKEMFPHTHAQAHIAVAETRPETIVTKASCVTQMMQNSAWCVLHVSSQSIPSFVCCRALTTTTNPANTCHHRETHREHWLSALWIKHLFEMVLCDYFALVLQLCCCSAVAFMAFRLVINCWTINCDQWFCLLLHSRMLCKRNIIVILCYVK